MLIYKQVTDLKELESVQGLERAVWQMEPIPTHQTLTAIKNGGVLAAAYDGERMIGFCYGFAGFEDGASYLCSHMMGILPEYRSQGVGEQLKRLQRDLAIQKGYRLIRWTFDPLQTRNAYLNLTKLRGVCYSYCINCYGELKDGLNKGLPSDRFEVSWHIRSPHVENSYVPDGSGAIPLGNYVPTGQFGRLELDLPEVWDAPSYTVPVPADVQSIKEQDPSLALDWRMKTREIFTKAFAEGYAVVGVHKKDVFCEYVLVPVRELELK